ncbi:S-locus glycoprotein [Corchorus olitorius]|uniref:S-locus glycoprotein n=1 Tax=Corchorus olitorius TaxID=93759 RepID=A0A1R3KBS9_9ROSI|nr:S-locus glycoprotein [Corchorus olitorius]
MIISSILEFSEGADLLTKGEFIRDGETLVSEDQTFELGFFSPGQSRKRYVGIWYKKSPEAVVWVANRDKPVSDNTGVLAVNDNGNLVIVNQTYYVFWSAIANMSAPFPESPVAHLLNSGNLLLKNNNITVFDPVHVPDPTDPTDPRFLWQSFDNPTDTLLQGMKLRLNLKNGKNRYLISWKSPDDPSYGNFTFRLRINGLPQLYIEDKLENSKTLYRTGPWNGIGFGAIPAAAMTVFKPIVVINENESYFSYRTIIEFLGMRLQLNPSGSLQYLIMKPDTTELWNVFNSLPVDKCDSYGLCGANTICSTRSNNTCKCMPGFVLKSHEENLTDNSFPMNCVRESSLNCNGDRFQKLGEVKVPDLLNIKLSDGIHLQDCEAECLKDCSCTAYANLNISDGGSSCVMWFGDLMDMREVSGDNRIEEIYIRLPVSNQGSKNIIKAIISGIGVLIVIIIFVGVLCFFIFRKKSEKNRDGSLCLVKLESGRGETEVPLFTMSTIKKATDQFSVDNVIGSGGFGNVYKGNLDGREIAVKRLSKNSTQGVEQFSNEVVSIARLQHRNLVGLLGCCIQGDERMLIYEFMPNKSLDFFIFGMASLE